MIYDTLADTRENARKVTETGLIHFLCLCLKEPWLAMEAFSAFNQLFLNNPFRATLNFLVTDDLCFYETIQKFSENSHEFCYFINEMCSCLLRSRYDSIALKVAERFLHFELHIKLLDITNKSLQSIDPFLKKYNLVRTLFSRMFYVN